jgi:transposase
LSPKKRKIFTLCNKKGLLYDADPFYYRRVEFKGLSDEIGVKKSAAQLGIPYYTLAEWRQKRNKYGALAIVGSGNERTDPQRKREPELEKENAELRRANEILKRSARFFRERPEEVKACWKYKFVERNGDRWHAYEMCKAFGISESGYYKYLKNRGKLKRDDILLVEIKKILAEHPENNDNYGVQRIHLSLLQRGFRIGIRQVYRIMSKNNLLRNSSGILMV